jgi:hypothetical protein
MKVKLTLGSEGISVSDAISILANLNGAEVNRQVDVILLKSAVAASQNTPGTTIGEVEDDNTTSHADVTGQLDKDGLPWDERIHSSNKKMTAKGVWTRRRGISDLQFDQIAAELKAAGASIVQPAPAPYTPPAAAAPDQFQQPAPFTPPYTPPAPQAGIPHIPMQIAPIAPQQFQPPAPVQPVAPAPQPQAPQGYGIQDLFNKIQPMFAVNLEQAQAYVNSLTQRLSTHFQMQVQSVNDIAGRPDMIAYAMQLIAADGK